MAEFRHTEFERRGGRERCQKFDIVRNLSEYSTSCDPVIKDSFITAVDCGISHSTFSSGVSNRSEDGLFQLAFVLPLSFGGFYESIRDYE